MAFSDTTRVAAISRTVAGSVNTSPDASGAHNRDEHVALAA